MIRPALTGGERRSIPSGMRCGRCGFANPAGFRFCGGCGVPLEPGGALIREERKLVTALFCDVAGFTHRAERLDPEDIHRLLTRYFAKARAELERFGGTVEKFIGDAVVGLFGAPSAHGDDPERAVRAALAIREAVAELSDGDPEHDLHIRIGVTTGEALVAVEAVPREGEGMAWGDTLNVCARLQAGAPVDGILVDEATYRATRAVIDYAEAEAVLGKGKAEPISVWRALAPRSRFGVEEAHGTEAPLVGRDEELALLLETLQRVRRRRRPELVTIVGPPGIGKSRLVFELFRSIEAGKPLITWRQGRSPQHGEGIAYWALGEIFKRQAGVLDTDDAATAERKLGEAVRALVSEAEQAARIETHLRPLVGLSDDRSVRGDERGAAFTAWRRMLEALARARPLVLVFEDLHWADDGLLDFLEHMLEQAKAVPLLVVATARTELLDRRHDWAGQPCAELLLLPQLSDGQTARLISSLAGQEPLAERLTEALVAGAAGNPLYAVEYMRMLSDRGLMGEGADERLPLPESVHGIIAARLDMLPADEKVLLQEAAAIGRVVWPGALAATSARPLDWVETRLRNLERKEFFARARRSSVEREDEYRFRHVLVREVAYGQIPREQRGKIHRRAATWLESLSPDRAVDRAEMLAHHYLAALELGRAAGAETAVLAEHARYALRDGGDRALSLYAFPPAARFYRTALELWPDDDPERPALVFRLGKALFYAESSGAEELEEARDALLEAGEHGPAAEAESLLGLLSHHQGKQDSVFAHVERAVELVGSVGPSRSKAEVLLDLAGALAVANDPERAIAIAREALVLAESLELPQLKAHALGILGSARAQLGDMGGVTDLEHSIEIAERVGSPQSIFSYGSLADLACSMGDLHRCFELQAKAKRQAEHFGYGGFVRWLSAERVGECYWRGRWDEAFEDADRFIAEAEQGHRHFLESYCRDMRARMRLARGELEGALEDSGTALAFAHEAKDLQVLYPALAFHARALVAAGRPDEAGRVALELLELWRSKRDVFLVSSWVADLAYAALPLGIASELERCSSLTRTRTSWLEAATAFVEEDFARAASTYRAIGSRPDEAFARLQAARGLIAAGRESAAGNELGRALRFFRRVGASALLEESEVLLASGGGL
jgi:class 3 adenylate cyclase/tetratricopeptide (TPR) repeat protein